ncbi:hypothetical protein [Streptomyces mirabilis]
MRVPQDAIAQLSCFRADFYDSLMTRRLTRRKAWPAERRDVTPDYLAPAA